VDGQAARVPAPAPPGWAAGRYHGYRSGGGRHVTLHPVIAQVQLVRRPEEKHEPVVGNAWVLELRGGRRTVPSRLHADPAPPVARRVRLEGEDRGPVGGPAPGGTSRLSLSNPPRPPDESPGGTNSSSIVPHALLPAVDPVNGVRESRLFILEHLGLGPQPSP